MTEAPPPQPWAAQKVIACEGGREVHGYAVSTDGVRVEVVWALGSGRLRRKRFAAEEVFVPGRSRPWAGLPIEEAAPGTGRGAERS
jgi:hypothetical protein